MENSIGELWILSTQQMNSTNYIFKPHYQIENPQLNHITACVSGVTKNRSHLIAHTAAKIVVMIMNSIKGRMDRRMKMTNSDLIVEKDVYEWIGVKRTALWRLKKECGFPKPVLSRPAKYKKSAIQQWIDNGGINQKPAS